MNNFKTIQSKLEQFIRRYYTNELLKGAILFFAIGLLYFLFTLFIEHVLWLNTGFRTILFWAFIGVEFLLFLKFIALPLAKLFRLQKGIDYKTASKIIGRHFPEVNDKLLNILQLKETGSDSELLLASIEQKSIELSPIPFKLAINFKQNIKYLKYAAIPVLVLLFTFVSGHFNLFSDSYERVVNYKTAYEPPAPFQFFVINDDLNAIENKEFKLKISTSGERIPENAQIHFNNESYFLQQTAPGNFEYVFTQPKDALSFSFSANDVHSKTYELNVIKVPTLVNFEMVLDYPSYTRKKDEILQSTGNTIIPEGTEVTWKVNTNSTTQVTLYAKDTLDFIDKLNGNFEVSKQLYNDFNYNISTSNEDLKDYENLAFSIDVVKDAYPEIKLKVERDSIDDHSLYFFGQVSDDYGLSKLQIVYYDSQDHNDKYVETLPVSNSNFDEFVSAFPNQLELIEGVNYEFYFQVFDNDALHNYKSTKSSIFTYRKLTQDEIENKQLEDQNETIKDLNKSFDKLEQQDKQLEELSKIQKEKSELNFNDKKKFQEFIKRQKQQEEMMQNFNKKLQQNLEEFQNENEEHDEFKEALKERLNENEEQLKKDEKLLEELEKLQEKIKKEQLTEKLEELAKQNKNKKRSLAQLLELTKRYYVTKKLEKLQNDLDNLSEEQEKLSEEDQENNTTEAQEKLNEKFEEFQEELEELKKDNKELKKPMDVPADKNEEESIKKDQKEATEDLQKQEENQVQDNVSPPQENQKNAQKKQKSAAKKMKEMSKKMEQAMGMSSGEQLSEDADMLRQILDNLILFSFDQEKLMNTFQTVDINHNAYGKYLRNQSNLREHFEHIDDSLFALSLRQPKLSEKVNTKITDVFYYIDKSMDHLSENQLSQGIASQQYTVTVTNDLASFLSDVLDNMESQMNPSPGSGQGDMQLPDIIMSQEELNKQMQEGMKKNNEGDPKQGKSDKDKGEKEGNKNGEKEGQKSGDGKEGKEGNKENGGGKGDSESINGELYEIYKQQQQLRQALQNKLNKEGISPQGKALLQQMEEVELDLINKGFTNQTLQKMMNLQHQLLKLDNATFTQGHENKRKSETNRNQFSNSAKSQIPTAKEYFNTIEILNRQALPLQQVYKKKVQEYFKQAND